MIGYPLSAYIARRPQRLQNVLLVLLFTPLWTSVVIRTYVWVVILQRNGLLDQVLRDIGLPLLNGRLLNTQTAVLIGMVQVLIPFGVVPIYVAFRALDPSLLQAASSLGADNRHQWTRVIIPLTSSGAIAGGLLVFLLALGFYITPAILGGPRVLMVATLIGEQVREFNLPFAAALSVMLLLGTLAVLLVIQLATIIGKRKGTQ